MQPPSESALRPELERLLACRVVAMEHRPNPYRSSFAMHELDLALEDGATLELIVKDLGLDSLDDAAHAKPAFAHDPAREIEVYRAILEREQLGTARYYGSVSDLAAGRFWLVLERVPGERLAFVGEFETWEAVARWLARMHDRFAALVPQLPPATAARLLAYDSGFYRNWLGHAEDALGGERPELDRIRSVYDRVIERLSALEPTIVHGEFYAENVLVERANGGLRVCPVDWEMAGFAPGVVDVAGLTAGDWSPDQRKALALAYHGALEAARESPAEFLEALGLCRIHLALQWAATEQEPDRAERWLAEAVATAAELGL